jgi:hypothetical protein
MPLFARARVEYVTEALTADRVARNESIFRDANERIRRAADDHGVDGGIPFVCECADPDCRAIIVVNLDDYRAVRSNPRLFVDADGHEANAGGYGTVVERRDGYVVVEKLGRAGATAEELDPP